MFTARYGLSSYIKQTCFLFKGSSSESDYCTASCLSTERVCLVCSVWVFVKDRHLNTYIVTELRKRNTVQNGIFVHCHFRLCITGYGLSYNSFIKEFYPIYIQKLSSHLAKNAIHMQPVFVTEIKC